MLIIGRITKDATVNKTKNDRQVVNFSIAINDSYKTKDGERRQFTTYVNCSYWINTGVSCLLLKGALVELSGRINVNAYAGLNGEPRASLNCQVDKIRIHGAVKKSGESAIPQESAVIKEDLPF